MDDLRYHYYDTYYSLLNVNSSIATFKKDPAEGCLNAVPLLATPGQSSREGRAIRLKRLQIRGHFRWQYSSGFGADTPHVQTRLFVFVDKQTNGATYTASKYLKAVGGGVPAVLSFRNADYFQRFDTLVDEVYEAPQVAVLITARTITGSTTQDASAKGTGKLTTDTAGSYPIFTKQHTNGTMGSGTSTTNTPTTAVWSFTQPSVSSNLGNRDTKIDNLVTNLTEVDCGKLNFTGQSTVTQYHSFPFLVNFSYDIPLDLGVLFNGAAADIASITDNSIHVAAVASGNYACAIEYAARVWFCDETM